VARETWAAAAISSMLASGAGLQQLSGSLEDLLCVRFGVGSPAADALLLRGARMKGSGHRGSLPRLTS